MSRLTKKQRFLARMGVPQKKATSKTKHKQLEEQLRNFAQVSVYHSKSSASRYYTVISHETKKTVKIRLSDHDNPAADGDVDLRFNGEWTVPEMIEAVWHHLDRGVSL